MFTNASLIYHLNITKRPYCSNILFQQEKKVYRLVINNPPKLVNLFYKVSNTNKNKKYSRTYIKLFHKK